MCYIDKIERGETLSRPEMLAIRKLPYDEQRQIHSAITLTEDRRYYTGLTQDDVLEIAHRKYDDDAYGQTLPSAFIRAEESKLKMLGLPHEKLTDAAVEAEASERAASEKVEQENAAFDAEVSVHMAAAEAAREQVLLEYPAEHVTDARTVAIHLHFNGGVALEVARKLAADSVAKKASEDACYVPETFGFSHGTDFEGSSW